jgi:hypothetical protein
LRVCAAVEMDASRNEHRTAQADFRDRCLIDFDNVL